MNQHNDSASTDLYLVRIWRGRPGADAHEVYGKVQHVVSGAASTFEGLAALSGVLEKMMEKETSVFDQVEDRPASVEDSSRGG